MSTLGIRRLADRALILGAVFAIRCYQAMVRPLLIGHCKFCPTCSEYGAEAFARHGFRRGLILALRRFCRCHPFSSGGIDPVPNPSPAPVPLPSNRETD